MATMKAARWHNRKDVRVEEVEVPEITRENQIKIAVKYSGICGSDLHEYLGGPIFIPANAPHPYTNEKAPITMGHEFCGEVIEVGNKITKFKGFKFDFKNHGKECIQTYETDYSIVICEIFKTAYPPVDSFDDATDVAKVKENLVQLGFEEVQ